MNNTILITGGAGFIGSAVIRFLLERNTCDVVNIDKLTYAGNESTISAFNSNSRYSFEKEDICNREKIREIFHRYQPRAIMHLAAESHVDRSIDGPWEFVNTNIIGTYSLLEATRDYLASMDGDISTFRFHHVSTDEVFGTLGDSGQFSEDSPYQPNSPYSASKASSDHLVRSWYETFGLPVVLSNCSNNYGPYQYPEKLLPVIISNAINLQTIPVYGTGSNIRDWLFVDDHASALVTIMERGETGRSYNVGGNEERTNLDVVKTVCQILDRLHPASSGKPYIDLIEFVRDRPGHDFRYAIDASRIKKELGWEPAETFDTGMEKTVLWYLQNADWVNSVQNKNKLRGQRLGSVSKLSGVNSVGKFAVSEAKQ